MRKKRINYTSEFKLKVVLETFREESTINEIGAKHGIDPKNIRNWREQFLENGQLIFEQQELNEALKEERKQHAIEVEELHKQIGKTTVINDWLKKKCKELGLPYEMPIYRD